MYISQKFNILETRIVPEWKKEEGFETEFKTLDKSQFDDRFKIKTSSILPDNTGYITHIICKVIDPESSNTVICNCPTGSGKSTTMYEFMYRYFKEDHVVVVISPRRTIVRKDLGHLLEIGIRKNDIQVYDRVGNSE